MRKARVRQMRYRRTRRWLIPAALIAPVVLLRGVTAVWPLVESGRLSLYRSGPISGPDKYIGLSNYTKLFADPTFTESLRFTLIFALVSTCIQLVLGIATASLIASSRRAAAVLRPLALVVWAIPVVVVGIAFRFGIEPNFGMIADIVRRLTGVDVDWLTGSVSAQIAVIGTNVWRGMPFVAIIMTAARQSVPVEYYEAAKVDGASVWQTFRMITFPAILPTVSSVAILVTIIQMSTFDLILAMTGGGPASSTEVLGFTAYRIGFVNLDFGEASAVGMVLFGLVAAAGLIGIVVQRIADRKAG